MVDVLRLLLSFTVLMLPFAPAQAQSSFDRGALLPCDSSAPRLIQPRRLGLVFDFVTGRVDVVLIGFSPTSIVDFSQVFFFKWIGW